MSIENQNSHLKISELAKLKELMRIIGDSDPMAAENRFFSNIGCNTEKEKIDFESKYILSTLTKEPEKHKKLLSNYDETTKMIGVILKNLNDFRTKDFPIIKRYFIVLELRLGLSISFFSEVENVYNSSIEKFEQEYKTKNKDVMDYVTEFNDKKILIENYKENKYYNDNIKKEDYLKNNKKKGL